jgi:O-antigen/teichoic acid export membrane protein
VTSIDEGSSRSSENFQELKKKSIAGMGALLVRQILVKVIFFAGNIVLARILAPEIFGIYAIVNFIVTFFSTFGDVGIGAALIQKQGELSKEELSTTFWLQQMLVWTVVVIAIVVAPFASKIYPSLPPAGVWLIRAMALSFLLSSLKTIPAILMERKIDFKRIAWVDITENIAFQAVAVSCALMGFEAWSFILAAISRALLGTIIIFTLSPWRPTFHFRYKSVQGLVRFGLPYQGNQILNFVKDAVTPLFVGAYAGAAAVGYLNWARNFAFAPMMISESFGRVAFPAYSKLQGDSDVLKRTIERSIRMMTLIMFPVTALLVALAPQITHVVFTDKWLPGLNAFYFFCIAPGFIGIFLPLYSAILSLGNSRILLTFSTCLVFIEWGLGIPFVMKYGFIGAACTQPITIFIFTLIYQYVLKRHGLRVEIFNNTYRCFFVSLLLLAVIKIVLQSYIHVNLFTICLMSLMSCFFYVATVYLVNKNAIVEFWEYLKLAVR